MRLKHLACLLTCLACCQVISCTVAADAVVVAEEGAAAAAEVAEHAVAVAAAVFMRRWRHVTPLGRQFRRRGSSPIRWHVAAQHAHSRILQAVRTIGPAAAR